jgi:hypothetical protein
MTIRVGIAVAQCILKLRCVLGEKRGLSKSIVDISLLSSLIPALFRVGRAVRTYVCSGEEEKSGSRQKEERWREKRGDGMTSDGLALFPDTNRRVLPSHVYTIITAALPSRPPPTPQQNNITKK